MPILQVIVVCSLSLSLSLSFSRESWCERGCANCNPCWNRRICSFKRFGTKRNMRLRSVNVSLSFWQLRMSSHHQKGPFPTGLEQLPRSRRTKRMERGTARERARDCLLRLTAKFERL